MMKRFGVLLGEIQPARREQACVSLGRATTDNVNSGKIGVIGGRIRRTRGVAMLPPAYKISPADLERGHAAFKKNEPRDLFYRAATALVSLALVETATMSAFCVAEALAVLLQTWNASYYRFKAKTLDREKHFKDIEGLLSKNWSIPPKCRNTTIDNLHGVVDHIQLCKLFNEFETVLGPVGAAKALHLLAPKLFPLWDRKIAKAYKCHLAGVGSNGDRYLAVHGDCKGANYGSKAGR